MKPYDFFRKLKIDRFIWLIDSKIRFALKNSKRRIYYLLKKRRKQGSYQNILVIANLGGIGNCIAATPLVQALRIVYPQAFIVFLAVNGDLFDNWCVPDLIIKDTNNIPDTDFDIVCAAYWGYPYPPKWVERIKTKRLMLPKVLFNSWFLKPERNYNVEMAQKLGYKGSIPPEHVSIKPVQIEISTKRIAILPCSNLDPKWQGKRWPYYQELVKLLLDEYADYQIIVIGTLNDDISNIDFSDRVIDLRGKLSLSETAWVLRDSFFTVGNDCGPAHIADCVGAKTFVIFGSTCDVKNKFVNKTVSILPKRACSPCQYEDIKQCDTECIKSISAKEVLEVILETLNKIPRLAT